MSALMSVCGSILKNVFSPDLRSSSFGPLSLSSVYVCMYVSVCVRERVCDG